MRLKFVNISFDASSAYHHAAINPNYFILKTYYKIKRPENYNKIQWTKPIVFDQLTKSEFVNRILDEKIDILCFSLYVWNSNYSLKLMKAVREQCPNIKIIIGGPDIYANIDPDYFSKYPFVDYAVYGNGEDAFKEIIDSIIENRPLSDDTVNVVTPDRKYQHKVFDDPEFKKISPYLESKEEVIDQVEFLLNQGFKREEISIRYERSRGCPYKCTFCDWNSGLHNKVKRKTNDWKEELDFLMSFRTKIRTTDANWGLYAEDLEITQYLIDNGIEYTPNAVAKLQKDRVFKIFEMFAEDAKKKGYVKTFVISLQDTDKTILDNINRPEIPWEEHREKLKYFKDKYRDNISYIGEVIFGLPGQTIDTTITMLSDFVYPEFDYLIVYRLDFLPNSPMANEDYRKKHGMKFQEMIVVRGKAFDTKEEIYAAADNGVEGYLSVPQVYETATADFVDIMIMQVFGFMYPQIHKDYKLKPNASDIIALIYETIYPKLRKEYEEHSKFIIENGIYGIKADKIYSVKDYCTKVKPYWNYL